MIKIKIKLLKKFKIRLTKKKIIKKIYKHNYREKFNKILIKISYLRMNIMNISRPY